MYSAWETSGQPQPISTESTASRTIGSAHIRSSLRSARRALSHSGNPFLSTEAEASACACIAAVIYNPMHEVGVALVELPSMNMVLTQFRDTSGFARLHSFLFARNPVEVLLPGQGHTHRDALTTSLVEHFVDVTFTAVPRQYFNAESGKDHLLHLASSGSSVPLHCAYYLCTAAANAVLAYTEALHGYGMQAHTVLVRVAAPEGFADVPRSTAYAIGLLRPHGSPVTTCGHPSHHRRGNPCEPAQRRNDGELSTVSLMAALPRTCTVMGQRLLHSSLLQPLRDLQSILDRQEMVGWLAENPRQLQRTKDALMSLAGCDTDKLIALFAFAKPFDTDERRQQLIQALLYLWSMVKALIQLRQFLARDDNGAHGGAGSFLAEQSNARPPQVLQQLVMALNACELEGLLRLLEGYLDPNYRDMLPPSAASNGRSGLQSARRPALGRHGAAAGVEHNAAPAQEASHDRGSREDSNQQRLLAMFRMVHAIRSPVLEVPQMDFDEAIQGIAAHFEDMRSQYGVHTLRLEASRTNLFVFSFSIAEAEKIVAARAFTNVYAGGQHFALLGRALREQWEAHYELYGQPLHQVPSGGVWGEAGASRHDREEARGLEESGAARPSRQPIMGGAPPDKKRLSRRRAQCQTETLVALCHKAQRIQCAALDAAVTVVGDLLPHLRTRIGALQVATEAVALLDMLAAFATYTVRHQAVQPTFASPTDGKADEHRAPPRIIGLQEMRHPSLRPGSSQRAVTNSVTWPTSVSVLLLTGPNGAGKTTLLRIVGQLWTLAQCGCYIPVRTAHLFIADRILSHMLCGEAPSVLTSEATREVMEMGPITHTATPQSLVLFDEPGRSMTPVLGLSFASTAVRWCLDGNIRAICCTHYAELTAIALVRPSCANMHFLRHETVDMQSAGGRTQTIYRSGHRLVAGNGGWQARYGLRTAEACGVPAELIAKAEEMYDELAVTEVVCHAATVDYDEERRCSTLPAVTADHTERSSAQGMASSPSRTTPPAAGTVVSSFLGPPVEPLHNLTADAAAIAGHPLPPCSPPTHSEQVPLATGGRGNRLWPSWSSLCPTRSPPVYSSPHTTGGVVSGACEAPESSPLWE